MTQTNLLRERMIMDFGTERTEQAEAYAGGTLARCFNNGWLPKHQCIELAGGWKSLVAQCAAAALYSPDRQQGVNDFVSFLQSYFYHEVNANAREAEHKAYITVNGVDSVKLETTGAGRKVPFGEPLFGFPFNPYIGTKSSVFEASWERVDDTLESAGLTPAEIEVFSHYISIRSPKEIAEMLGLPDGTVKTRIRIAQRKLRKSLASQG